MTRLREWFANLTLTVAWRMVAAANAERDQAVNRAIRARLERDVAVEAKRTALERWRVEHAAAERLRADLSCWMDEHSVRGDQ